MAYRRVYVFADWEGLPEGILMGQLQSELIRGKEVFSFHYSPEWLSTNFAQMLDPDLVFSEGLQYLSDNKTNFGLFLDSSPDRWGRVLLRRREVALARLEKRVPQNLRELDFLLGVFDGNRMGGLRFKKEIDLNEEEQEFMDLSIPEFDKTIAGKILDEIFEDLLL